MLQPFKKYLEYMLMTIKGVWVGYTFFPNKTSTNAQLHFRQLPNVTFANIDERPLIFRKFRCHFGIA